MADELTDEQKAAQAAADAAAKAAQEKADKAATKAARNAEKAKADVEAGVQTIVIAQAFTLVRDDGSQKHFEIGMHRDVPNEDAEHWYVQAHLAPDADASE